MRESPVRARKWEGNAVRRGAGKKPRSGPKRVRSEPEIAAKCTYAVRRHGGAMLTSTGLAAALEREAKKLVIATRSLVRKQNELEITAANRCCSVEALADQELTRLENGYAAQLFKVRQVEWNFTEANFQPLNPLEAVKQSNQSHANSKHKAPEEAPVLREEPPAHPVWVNSIHGPRADVPACPALSKGAV